MIESQRRHTAKVVLFGSYAPSLVRFRGPLIQEMVRRGHQVVAIAPEIDSATADMLRTIGAEPISVSLGRTSLNPVEAIRTRRHLEKIFRELRPDVMIAYAIKPIVIGVPAARRAGVKRIVALVTGLGYAFTGGREPVRLASRAAATVLYRRAFARSDVVLFQNKDDLEDFRRLRVLPPSSQRGIINGSGVDVDFFAPAPLPAGASFLMIARLVGDKGIREFGEAAKRLKELHPEVRISLVGALATEPHAISEEELNGLIEGGIDYLGPTGDVRPAIAAHSVYVLPTYREGTPRSVLEALSMARAVITTDAPGARETVVDGVNGLLVPPRDAGALLAAMLRLVRRPELIGGMAAESRRIAEEKYDVRKVNEALLGHAGL